MLKYLIFILSLCFLIACGDNSEETTETDAGGCRFGEPVALFQDSLAVVDSVSFMQEGRSGRELVFFNNRLQLELTQTGCETLKQEFAFTIPMTNPTADGAFWIAQGEQLMRFLGNIDKDLVQFNEWANVIAQNMREMKLGEAKEVQTGYFVTVDKIESGEETVVQVILENQ